MTDANITLYTLGAQYSMLLDKLAAGDFDAQTVADTIEASGIIDDIDHKVEGYELVARTIEQFNPALDAEIARLKALKEKRALAAAALRKRVLLFFIEHSIERVTTARFTISLRQNPEAVDVFDERMIPAQFMKTPKAPEPAPDKLAIKAELAAGRDVPGARLTRGHRLDVK